MEKPRKIYQLHDLFSQADEVDADLLWETYCKDNFEIEYTPKNPGHTLVSCRRSDSARRFPDKPFRKYHIVLYSWNSSRIIGIIQHLLRHYIILYQIKQPHRYCNLSFFRILYIG